VAAGPGGEVSEREAQVLAALGAHLTNAQIASRLSISIRTVESHVSSLLRKLGVADRRELASMSHLAGPESRPIAQIRALPVARTSFVGRERERAAVLAALDGSRLVHLVGPGGVGKTRLATVVAESSGLVGAFVDLVPVRDGLLSQAVATALGVVERPRAPLDDVVLQSLRRPNCLLVLDNCEHLLDAVSAFVERMLTACPELRVLTTSRQPPGASGRTLPVPPLSLVSGSTGGPAGSEAETLFNDRAVEADPGFQADPELVRTLCGRLDGMPLAIELAAARSASLGVDGLLTALADHLRALTGSRAADPRHWSMRAVIDWSHDLLDTDERTLFRRLGIFVGGFDIAAAAAVAGDMPAAEVADVLGRLIDKNMVAHQRRSPTGRRWRLLETVRAYAAEQLAASGEEDSVRGRHGTWAMAAATTLEDALEGPLGAGEAWRESFDLIADDLRAAAAGSGATAGRLGRTLAHLLYARRFFTEARARYEHAARTARSPAETIADLRSAAEIAMIEARCDLAYPLVLEIADRAAAGADPRTQSIALANAVIVGTRGAGEFAERVPHDDLLALLARARELAPEGDPDVEAYITGAQAWFPPVGDHDVDRATAHAALLAARRCADPVLESCALDAMSTVAAEHGRYREAYAMWRERVQVVNTRLPRYQPSSAPEIYDTALVGADFALGVGDLAGALDAAESARQDDIFGGLAHGVASRFLTPLVLFGRFDEAVGYAEEMWEGWQHAGAPAAPWLAPAAYSMVIVYESRGDAAAADRWRGRSRQICGGSRPRADVGPFATFADARGALHLGRWDDAPRLIAQVGHGSVSSSAPSSLFRLHRAYALAAVAELAVAAGPGAGAPIGLLEDARAAAAENDWAAACLARLAGRAGDRDALEAAVAAWERLDARLERACTLHLIPERRAEAAEEFASLGVLPPA